ncbi:hypothetical protein ACTNA4_07745 [Bariatricus sp. HCP28S3_A7]|uniref:hypothetical protein n=1 Tax=Bariatricus sp. HCP28S3_A7 TaxID=3438894 RepID=UPI003F8A5920
MKILKNIVHTAFCGSKYIVCNGNKNYADRHLSDNENANLEIERGVRKWGEKENPVAVGRSQSRTTTQAPSFRIRWTQPWCSTVPLTIRLSKL